QAPNAPSSLGAVPETATGINLTWSNNSTNQSGYHLDRATDSGFTQNLITQSLPATSNSFTDTANGLAPGSTFYYRIRAFNNAGESANSNIASVKIPLAPPTPSDAHVVDATTTSLDLTWTDNAGPLADEYDILRAVNHGAFTLYAIIPPPSAAPPSDYEW